MNLSKSWDIDFQLSHIKKYINILVAYVIDHHIQYKALDINVTRGIRTMLSEQLKQTVQCS